MARVGRFKMHIVCISQTNRERTRTDPNYDVIAKVRREQLKTLLISLPLRYEFRSKFVSNSFSELNNQFISQTNRERRRTDPICDGAPTADRIL